MDILIFDRLHANGAIACVQRDSEGAGYRPSSIPPRDELDEPAWPYLDTINEAQAAADILAHPDCTGLGCQTWVAHRDRPIE